MERNVDCCYSFQQKAKIGDKIVSKLNAAFPILVGRFWHEAAERGEGRAERKSDGSSYGVVN